MTIRAIVIFGFAFAARSIGVEVWNRQIVIP
jgi:hypothetical protein